MPIDAGGKLVIAHRAHGAAEPGIRQMPDEIADERQHRDAEGEIGLARSGTDRDGRYRETPSGPWVSQIALIMTSVTICWNEIVTMAR